MKNVNLNSVLVAIVIALAGWNLTETISQGRSATAQSERMLNIVAKQVEMQTEQTAQRNRMAVLEADLTSLRIEVVKLQRDSK